MTCLIRISQQLWQDFWIDKDFDAASNARFPLDESRAFKRQHHLVNGRRCDAKILLHVGFRWRSAMQARVQVDIRQVLPLLGRKGFAERLTPAIRFSCSSVPPTSAGHG
jgi:hypothetical protein